MPSFAAFGNDLHSGKPLDRLHRPQPAVVHDRRRRGPRLASLSLGLRGLNLGIEFKGGSEFTVSQVRTPSTRLAQDAVKPRSSPARPHRRSASSAATASGSRPAS